MPVRILHAHSTFSLGGKEARGVRLMNAFGDRASHVVWSAMPDQLGARSRIDRGIAAAFPTDAPPLSGRPGLARLFRIARYMRGFDLVLTYNWGGFDAVMARHLFGGPPLVHHEDGFNEDEADRLKPSRNLYRRLGLGAAFKLVVPSRRLERIARTLWGQPQSKIDRIANGIPVEKFRKGASDAAVPGFIRRRDEIVIGTIAGLRPVKNLPRLVRAVAAMQRPNVRLIIVGQGPESECIAAEARRCGIADRLMMPGFFDDPSSILGMFDIFALSSDSEQFPISLAEAMATGLPVVATAVGDVQTMVSDDTRPLIVGAEDEGAFSAALDTLAERPDLRRTIGLANFEQARAELDEAHMIERYARLYGEAIGAPGAFLP